MQDTLFATQDTTVALPRLGFEVSEAAWAEADAICALPPHELYRRLLTDQESEAVHVAARRVIAAFLPAPGNGPGEPPATPDDIAAEVQRVRDELAATIAGLPREVALRERAPLALLGGCWLDTVSQPATQPSLLVNLLLRQHFLLRGAGSPHRSVHAARRRALERAGVHLPEIGAASFLARTGARPLTALHGAFYLALSRLPANFLPELTGVHYVTGALGVDDLLAGEPPVLQEPELRQVLDLFLVAADARAGARLQAGIRLALDLEREHVTMLAELAGWHAMLSPGARAATVVARHARYAGRHHLRVRVGGRSLTEVFADPAFDAAAFLTEFRGTPYLRRGPDGLCPFLRAIKFGGPMFGIFDAAEAATLREWAEAPDPADLDAKATDRAAAGPAAPDPAAAGPAAGEAAARARAAALRASAPDDVIVTRSGPGEPDDRELFFRLINIENYPDTRPLALARAARLFDEAEIMFVHGAAGRYTDASWFDYSPEALYERADRIYWEKLIAPYQPLTEIPDKDEVIFLQTTYALGALIDAAWLHRTANLGRHERDIDGALLSIYADEMGHGDMRKNHITLIYRALRSMDIRLPHIRDRAFMTQADLPDDLYGFSLHQLCMALFPDTWFCEILGYNLAIEMFGLGELRLHEIQKLRHHGFDDCYERAHLTIDNLSAGHSKQAADIIVAHLDHVQRTLGDAAMRDQWRRVWRGYASYAYIVEHELVRRLRAAETADILLLSATSEATGQCLSGCAPALGCTSGR